MDKNIQEHVSSTQAHSARLARSMCAVMLVRYSQSQSIHIFHHHNNGSSNDDDDNHDHDNDHNRRPPPVISSLRLRLCKTSASILSPVASAQGTSSASGCSPIPLHAASREHGATLPELSTRRPVRKPAETAGLAAQLRRQASREGGVNAVVLLPRRSAPRRSPGSSGEQERP